MASFEVHSKSTAHKVAVSTHLHESKPVDTLLSTAKALQQKEARAHLLKIVGSMKLLGRQGLAFRGHDNDNGNLHQLLKLRSEDDPGLSQWLQARHHNYTSPEVQNEILKIMANSIVREIASSIRDLPVLQFSIIIDGTQDIAGVEQESICLRYVDHDLVPREEFVGLYEVSLTTGENLAKVATDVLQRLSLPFSGLRGQTYDGAANMSGKINGAQAKLREKQPLALYVHCGPHCVNLVTQAACTVSPLTSDALSWVHTLGCTLSQSGKYKCLFKDLATSEQGSFKTIKPLCPTRWTVRSPAIQTVLQQYEPVLGSLEEMSAGSGSDTATKARGLLEKFQKGTTVLGLLVASEVIGELECLNKSLQKKTQSVPGMLAAVECVKSTLQAKRSEENFQQIYDRATEFIAKHNIEPI